MAGVDVGEVASTVRGYHTKYSAMPLSSKNSASTCGEMETERQGPVLAKIQWKNMEYYVRQKRVTIGRHSSKGEVDIDLGQSNFISRVHLEIVFQEPYFFLRCNGKNGIFVDGDFQRPSDGLQILRSKCLIRFPSTGMFLVFSSLVAEPGTQPYLLPAAAVSGSSPTLSPAGTISACSSRPVSPRLGEVTTISSNGGSGSSGSVPLLHHSYSSGPAEPSTGRPETEPAGTDLTTDLERAKPPFSYAQLIVQALSRAKDRQLTLSGIYSFITRHYPYYRTADKGWQNSIRHNLSLNRYFIKVARSEEDPGKGSFWRVEPQSEARLVEQAFKRRRRAGTGTGHRQPAGSVELSLDSPAYRTPGGATPPYVISRETSPTRRSGSPPHSAAGTYTAGGVAATVIVTPGRSGDVARARLVPLLADGGVTSQAPENDVIIAPSDIAFLSDECLITCDPAPAEVTVVSSTAPAGDGPR